LAHHIVRWRKVKKSQNGSTASKKQKPVCTENLNPDIMVMKSAENRVCDIPDPLNGTKGRRTFVQ
jgi:hypothetical protein